MERIKDVFSHLDLVPFILATGQHSKLSLVRIIEAIIIAGITGAVVLYGMTLVIGERLDGFKITYDRDRVETTVWRSHIQDEVDETQKFLYSHGPHSSEK